MIMKVITEILKFSFKAQNIKSIFKKRKKKKKKKKKEKKDLI